MVENLYKNFEHDNSDSFCWIKIPVIRVLQNIFGGRSRDKWIINYAVENREDGEMIINYDVDGQKYILGVDPYDKKLMFITDNLPHHKNIKRKYIPSWFCLWWWRVTIDNGSRVIELYWKSKVYGDVVWKEKEAVIGLLKKAYPNYIIWFK